MPWSDPHPLKLPPPSEALAKQLSQSQRSVPGSQLLAFVSALDDDNSREGDPLLRVWDSMHRAMLLVLAALQSLPIRPHPQHPDPAATTLAHTTTSQLPPGYHRCSACLLLSLRLAIFLTQHCVDQPLDKDLALARLHTTLPRLLLGLSTAMSVMQAAGHPEAQAQCVQFVRCLLLLGLKLAINLAITIPTASSNSSRHHNSSRGQASSRGPRGDTGRSGAARSAGDKLHAQDVVSYGYLTQALWDVFGRQEEGFASKVFNTSSQEGKQAEYSLHHLHYLPQVYSIEAYNRSTGEAYNREVLAYLRTIRSYRHMYMAWMQHLMRASQCSAVQLPNLKSEYWTAIPSQAAVMTGQPIAWLHGWPAAGQR
ncbi:hypothetical protein V8C86DRAFT_1678412 [Haematococcus lacustris]